jgi:hypothetical protein
MVKRNWKNLKETELMKKVQYNIQFNTRFILKDRFYFLKYIK